MSLYLKSWLGGFDPPTHRYAIRVLRLHALSQDSLIALGRALAAMGITKQRAQSVYLDHVNLVLTLNTVKRQMVNLKAPPSKDLDAFRDCFMRHLEEYHESANGKWAQLARPLLLNAGTMDDDEAIRVLDESTELLALVALRSEEFANAYRAFLDQNERKRAKPARSS